MKEWREVPVLYRRWARVRDWQEAANWISRGRSPEHRPLYHHYLSVAYTNPHDKSSDIVINWRYKHINPNYKDLTRFIVKFTKDGRTYISPDGGYGRSGRRAMEEYANLVGIRWDYYSKTLIIRQPDDPVISKKGLQRCRRCTGSKKEIYTCTQGFWSRPNDKYLSYECSHYEVGDLRRDAPHLITEDCRRCEGNGKTIPLARFQSFKWIADEEGDFEPLEVNPITSKLILQEELCTS